MIELDIDRMFEDPNDPALGIVVRFNSLERYLELLLEFTPHIQDQTLVRFEADLARKAKSLSSEDMHIELEGVKEEIEQLIPTSFYGAFVLALFAALESSVTDIANYVRGRELSSLAVSFRQACMN